MKKLILILTASTFMFACTPKASKNTAATTPAGPTVSAEMSTEPNEAQVTTAKAKFPDVTLDVLKKGHSIYYGACTHCHGAKNIVKRDEKEWVGILDDMAPKAHLTSEEKDAVWKYIMSVKLAAK